MFNPFIITYPVKKWHVFKKVLGIYKGDGKFLVQICEIYIRYKILYRYFKFRPNSILHRNFLRIQDTSCVIFAHNGSRDISFYLF